MNDDKSNRVRVVADSKDPGENDRQPLTNLGSTVTAFGIHQASSAGRNFHHHGFANVEHREWWLWSTAVLIILILTAGLVSFFLPHSQLGKATQFFGLVRGLVALVLLFVVYVIYQNLQIYCIRQQLLDQEKLFRLISENAADMIALVAADGTRLYNSPAYARVLGYSEEELKGSSGFEQIHPEDRAYVQEAALETLRTGCGRRIEYQMRHKDGNWLTLESTASAITDSHGQVTQLVIVNRDITDRKRLEEQFRQSQKMEAIGRLSGGIAHDFNNLLGVIIGFAEVLEAQVAKDPSLSDCVAEILKAGKNAGSLTRQLLAFSRQQVLEPTVLDLNRIIAEIEKMLKRIIGEDIELTTNLDKSLGRIKADEGQIKQILLNLAVNARDAMPQGGKLVIETKTVDIDAQSTRRFSYPVKQGSYVMFSVADGGMGMDQATQSRIFEPFFTTKEKGKGTGLGLATVYGIVKQSGGYIDLSSEPGKGACFKVYLPKVEGEMTAKTPQAEAAKLADSLNKTVLLVEDEPSMLKVACHLLEPLQFSVIPAGGPKEALQISQQYPGKIDLIITDVVMPEMSGPELVEVLKKARPESKVLFVSGYTGQTFGRSEGMFPEASFLMKPFTRLQLEKKVNEVLHGEPVARRVPEYQ